MSIAHATAGIRLWMSAGSRGEHFGVLNWSSEEQRLSGYIGSTTGAAIPTVRPVSMVVPLAGDEEITDARLSAAGKWLLLRGSGERIANPSDMRVRQGAISAQADSWSDFLGGGSSPKSERRSSGLEGGITIPSADLDLLRATGLINDGASEIILMRPSSYRGGPPVDGFAAHSIHRAVARAQDTVVAAGDLDLERAGAALGSVTRPSSHAVSWYGTPDPEIGRLRLQAAQSYPILAGLIAESPSIARLVDAMEPIGEALGERTGLGKASLKRIGKLRAKLPDGPVFDADERVVGEDALGVNRIRRIAVRGAISLDTCLSRLAKMPPDRTPQTDKDWLAFAAGLTGCASPIHNVLGVEELRVLEGSKGNWEVWREQLARAADFEPGIFDRRALTLSTIDALEAIDDFSRVVVLPLVLRAIESTGQELPPQSPEYMQEALQAAGEIVLGKSRAIAPLLLEMGRRYASRIPSLMEIDGLQVLTVDERKEIRWQQYGDDAYPVLTKDFHAKNGRVIRALRNHSMNLTESARLKHCIGRLYQTRARETTSHLFSIQNESGEVSFSSFEISKLPDEGSRAECRSQMRIVQHRAMSNRDPDPASVEALKEWFTAFQTGNLELNITEIRDWRQYLKETRQTEQPYRIPSLTWKGALGTDWEDPDKVARHWEEWTGIIGQPSVRGDTPEVLFRHGAIRRLVEEMSPAAATILTERARAQAEARAAPEDPPAPA